MKSHLIICGALAAFSLSCCQFEYRPVHHASIIGEPAPQQAQAQTPAAVPTSFAAQPAQAPAATQTPKRKASPVSQKRPEVRATNNQTVIRPTASPVSQNSPVLMPAQRCCNPAH